MDCETARLFLHFDRPGEHDLDGTEADELRAHLEQCSACNTQALSSRRLDAHLGRAMRAVEVPAGLKSRLLNRLAADRRAVQRRWLGRGARVLAAAAVLLLLVWGGYSFYHPTRTRVDVQIIAHSLNVAGRNEESVDETLRRLPRTASVEGLRFDPGTPSIFNYGFLTGAPALVELPGYAGTMVPQLVFSDDKTHRAIVLVLDKRRFDLHEEDVSEGYKYRLEVVHPDEGHFVYLVFCTDRLQRDSWRSWLAQQED